MNNKKDLIRVLIRALRCKSISEECAYLNCPYFEKIFTVGCVYSRIICHRERAQDVAADIMECLEAENAALREQQEQPNDPLTLEELRGMAGNAVWCADTDGTYPGLLCYVECVLDDGKDAHIWLLDNEGNVGRYNVQCMIECGARFYRRKPEQEV